MTLRAFIKTNRAELDSLILRTMYRYDRKGGRVTVPGPPPRLNDDERRLWILNDEGLYSWARSEGCRI